jgi:hypothetical protein
MAALQTCPPTNRAKRLVDALAGIGFAHQNWSLASFYAQNLTALARVSSCDNSHKNSTNTS